MISPAIISLMGADPKLSGRKNVCACSYSFRHFSDKVVEMTLLKGSLH